MNTKQISRISCASVLLLFTVFFNSCSKDDDSSNDTLLCDTFLECNDTTKWKQVFIENDIETAHLYLRLNNDLNDPFENWLNFSTLNCYISMSISDHQFEIIENSKEILVVKIIWQELGWEQDEFETWTFTRQGESLKLVTQYFQEIITFDFNLSIDDVNNLEICTD